MKTWKTRILSAMLALLTLLTLLPTSALAASGSGTGIKPTTNPNLWSTRLTSTGQPYSYRPPMAAGRQLYCMDLGYSYRYGTASFLNSYTYQSATGADSDTLWDTAVAGTGLGEMDAITKENVKWMMTYITDYKGDIPGSLFMALQTYIWDHQSNKSAGGDTSGDIDAGGYANADTYETYLGYIDWMLKEKAKEDAEFQKQIEKYTAQGAVATIVEDESAKWAVYAKSSVSGRQSFFAYYAPRKLSFEVQPEEPDYPPAGDADITLKKVAAGTTRGLDGAKFNIYRDGQIVGSDVTQNGGIIEVKDVTKGLWSFVETEAPEGYCADSTPISVYVDTTDGDKQYTVTAENHKLPDMKITKRDAMSGKPIAGTVFSIKSVTGNYSTSVTTGVDGSATLSSIPVDVYVVREESVPEPYIVTNTEQTVALRPGKTSEVTFVDYVKPGLEILKKNIANGEPIEGVTYRIEQIDGSFSTSATTDNHGRIFLDSVPVGTFKVTEKNVPSHVILNPIPQEVALKPGETSTVTFFNALKPSLEIRKLDSVTGDPVKGAKFQIWYGSNHTDTGELNDLGTFFSDASGKIILPEVKDGWYKVTELEPASGYAIKEPATQECFISGGESKVLTFENTPLSAIIIRKVDSESGQPLEGAWFRVRYLSGTSGTGGTVVGEIKTSQNGTAILTGLAAGTYVCEEISAPDGYVITDATETVYLSGKDQDVITVTFGNDKMGSLLIVKKDAVTGAPISDVEFFITDSDGSVIGNANGKYVTDSAGTIRIDDLTPGMTVIAREVRAKDGYILDDTPQSIKIKRNSVMTLEFRNQPKGNFIIVKQDSVTKEPLEGVEFKIVYADGSYVDAAGGTLSSTGLYRTDKAGKISISGISGTIVATETKTIPGYTIDEATRSQTVVVSPNDTQTLHFYNTPSTTLVIEKYIEGTTTPLKGVTFLVTDGSGAVVGRSNGEFITDENGRVVINDLEPGTTVTVREVKTVDGFVLDSSPKSILIKAGEVQTLTFYNKKQGTLVIRKLDSVSLKPLSGVEFQITYADGGFVDAANGHLSSKGLYTTDANGEIRISGVTGTLVVKETKPLDGYVVDPATQSQTVEVNPLDTQTLTFYNTPEGGLQIIKSDADTGKRLSGVVFEIRKMDGEIIGTYTTDANGVIRIPNAKSGWYTIVERKAANGYRLDTMTPTQACVKDGETTTVEITNQRMCSIMIHKVDANTGKGLYGVKFVIYDSGKNPIMEVETDQDGYAYVRDELAPGKYFIRELEAANGYIRDEQYKTVYVEAGKCTQIEWENSAVTGQIQVRKYATDDNSVTGRHAGTALEGAVFEISQARSGSVVGYIVTDARGVAASGPLPLGRYYVTEVSAPKYYQLSGERMEAEIEYPNQIIKLSSYNKPAKLGVTIKKTGNYEVQPGQSMSYHFSGIANTSNVALNSFFWHDRIPTDATRAMSISTGTYNQRLYYKVTFMTNLNDYRTLASNLLTANNYSLSLNAATLGLVQGEYVTDVRFEFGTVPSGFTSVVKPAMRVQVLGTVSNGYQIINRADVGGKYLNEWQTAKSPWVTTVRRFQSISLPKTGY